MTAPITDWILTASPDAMGRWPQAVHETSAAVAAAIEASPLLRAIAGDPDEIVRAGEAARTMLAQGTVSQLDAEISAAAWRLLAERLDAAARALDVTGAGADAAMAARCAQEAWGLALTLDGISGRRLTDAQRAAGMRGEPMDLQA